MRFIFKFALVFVLLFAALASAQTTPPAITTSQLVLPISTNLPPVTSAAVTVIGNPGPQQLCYWAVANYLVGPTSPTFLSCLLNAPNTLSGSNYVQIVPVYPNGALVDILRTSGNSPPTGACNCAVATGVASGAINDQSSTLLSYTVTPFIGANFTYTIDNEVVGAGLTHAILRQNGVFVSDLTIGGSGGTLTGSGSNGTVPLWSGSSTNLANSPITVSGGTTSVAGNEAVSGSVSANTFVGVGALLLSSALPGSNFTPSATGLSELAIQADGNLYFSLGNNTSSPSAAFAKEMVVPSGGAPGQLLFLSSATPSWDGNVSDTGSQLNLISGFVLSWNVDTGLSRVSPDFLACGNGSALDETCTLAVGELIVGPNASSTLITASSGATPSTPASGLDNWWFDSTDLRFHEKNTAGTIGTTTVSSTCPTSNWVHSESGAGVLGCTQPAFGDLSGTGSVITTSTCPTGTVLNAGTCTATPTLGANGGTAGGVTYAGSTSGSAVTTTNATGSILGIAGSWEVPDNGGFLLSQNATSTGSTGARLGAVGTTTTEAFDFTGGTSTNLIFAGNPCKLVSDVTLSTSATTICTWTLPNAAKGWGWQCEFLYTVTAGTTPTLSIGVNASQTPTATTNGQATILTLDTALTGTIGIAAIGASGAINLLTSGTLTPAATIYTAKSSGTLAASATSGTFAITMTGVGASFAGAAKAGSVCFLF